MPQPKYEIEPVHWPHYRHESMISTLTGLEFDEIYKISADKPGGWNGQTYIKMINKLGFNTNNRFIKFDQETEYPCIMRCVSNKNNDPYWHGFVYYNGIFYNDLDIYDLKSNSKQLNGKTYLTCFDPTMRITSMLQVWI